MYCRICGTEKRVTYHVPQRQALCPACAKGMPAKVGREEFDILYWGDEGATVPEGIKREFYADYLASLDTVPRYIRHTVGV